MNDEKLLSFQPRSNDTKAIAVAIQTVRAAREAAEVQHVEAESIRHRLLSDGSATAAQLKACRSASAEARLDAEDLGALLAGLESRLVEAAKAEKLAQLRELAARRNERQAQFATWVRDRYQAIVAEVSKALEVEAEALGLSMQLNRTVMGLELEPELSRALTATVAAYTSPGTLLFRSVNLPVAAPVGATEDTILPFYRAAPDGFGGGGGVIAAGELARRHALPKFEEPAPLPPMPVHIANRSDGAATRYYAALRRMDQAAESGGASPIGAA